MHARAFARAFVRAFVRAQLKKQAPTPEPIFWDVSKQAALLVMFLVSGRQDTKTLLI
jgi:hypothetical protein